jgi:hypothetical protein
MKELELAEAEYRVLETKVQGQNEYRTVGSRPIDAEVSYLIANALWGVLREYADFDRLCHSKIRATLLVEY